MESYTHDDVIQAICCALAFGIDASSAAKDILEKAVAGEPSRWGLAPDKVGGILLPGAGNNIHISGPAMRLLAEAESQRDQRCMEIDYRFGQSFYDLRVRGRS